MNASAEKVDRLKPVLRWAGGKQALARRLFKEVPSDYMERRYFEPFLGAASLYLTLLPREAFLSDLNEDLIHMYKWVRSNRSLVSRYLARHKESNSDGYYYKIRSAFNAAHYFTAANAARFIYLNRTCFNGIYRVNREGDFNVPYGHKESPIFPQRDGIGRLSDALKPAQLKCATYSKALQKAKGGDFIYLDPPYPALNGTSYFAHYTRDRFSADDQDALASTVWELNRRDCLVLISNADTPMIRELYAGMQFIEISVPRYVTSGKHKHKVAELVIKNY